MAVTGAGNIKIGSAYIDIHPQIAQGSAQQLGQQLGGAVNGQQLGQQVGGQVAAGVGNGINSNGGAVSQAFKGLGSSVASVGLAVGTIAGGLAGVALKGGISRALNIEDAKSSLQGLGHSAAEVQGIMDSALSSVKGTAFGLDEAAKVAASSVAAGIKPGTDLTRILKLVADSATIAGTDMGSMGDIFNKVAATGKLQGGVINQLGSAGIPVLQMVAKEMGVTTEEASKMAGKNKISFETFANAMEKGLGGAALTAGDTFRGSLDNVGAAMSRFGAVVATPFLTTIKGVFDFLIPVIDGFTTKIKPMMEDLGFGFSQTVPRAIRIGVDSFQKFVDFIPTAVTAVNNMFPAFDRIKAMILPISGLFLALSSGALHSIPIIGQLIPAISPLAGILIGLIAASPELRKALGDTFMALIPIAQSIVVAMGPLLVVFSEIVTEVAKFAAWLLETLIPVMPVLVPVILAAVAGFKAWTLATTALAAAQVSLNIAQSQNPILFILSLITLLIVGFYYAYTQVEWFRDGVNGALGAIGGIFVGLYEWIVNVGLPAFGGFFVAIYEGAVTAGQGMDGFWKDTNRNLNNFATDAANNTQRTFTDIGGWFTNLGASIQNAFVGVGSWVRDAVRGAANSINSFIRDVQRNINNLLRGVNGLGFNLPSWLLGGARVGTNFGMVNLPQFGNGGTVNPVPGGTLGVIAERGRAETIVDTASLNRRNELLERLSKTDNTNRNSNGDVWNIHGYNKSPHELYNEFNRMKTWEK
jgi:tape measure domain-containing protein